VARVPDLDYDALTAEQRRLYEQIHGPRGLVAGPFALWLRVPAIGAAANQLGNAVRLDGQLDRKLFEIVILAIARHWTAQYEWFQHALAAERLGVAPAVIEAIRTGGDPPFPDLEQRLIYELTVELQTTKTLSPAIYDRALAAFGLETLIEAITAIGFYTAVAMMLNAFDAPVPGGTQPLEKLVSES
jgi:4-carboxymuconolactone decarboxylase